MESDVEEHMRNAMDSLESIDEEYFNYPSILQNEGADNEKIKEIEEKFFNLLKVINEDTRQLSEFLIEEENLVKEICAYLKKIFSRLDLSVALPRESFSILGPCKEIILNSQGHLILVREEDGVESKALEDYPPEVILTVVWVVIPKLKEVVSRYMRKVNVRVSFFERINSEFKSIQKAFETSREEAPEGSYKDFQERSIREVILSKE